MCWTFNLSTSHICLINTFLKIVIKKVAINVLLPSYIQTESDKDFFYREMLWLLTILIYIHIQCYTYICLLLHVLFTEVIVRIVVLVLKYDDFNIQINVLNIHNWFFSSL